MLTFPASGHGQIHACGEPVVLDYLATGTMPTAACITAPPALAFIGPTEPLTAGFVAPRWRPSRALQSHRAPRSRRPLGR